MPNNPYTQTAYRKSQLVKDHNRKGKKPTHDKMGYLDPELMIAEPICKSSLANRYFIRSKKSKKYVNALTPTQLLEYKKQPHHIIAIGSFLGSFVNVVGFFYLMITILVWAGFIMFCIGLGYTLLTNPLSLNFQILYRISFLFIYSYTARFILGKLIPHLPDSPKNYKVFDRHTGMVNFREKVTYPFADFDPIWAKNYNNTGGISYAFGYHHRYSGTIFTVKSGLPYSQLYIWAQYFDQFMDVECPLPDVPALEDFRHLDPTTQAYDQTNNRDPHFWRKKTKEEIRALEKAARIRAKETLKAQGVVGKPSDYLPYEVVDDDSTTIKH